MGSASTHFWEPNKAYQTLFLYNFCPSMMYYPYAQISCLLCKQAFPLLWGFCPILQRYCLAFVLIRDSLRLTIQPYIWSPQTRSQICQYLTSTHRKLVKKGAYLSVHNSCQILSAAFCRFWKAMQTSPNLSYLDKEERSLRPCPCDLGPCQWNYYSFYTNYW